MADSTFGEFSEFRTLRPYENVDAVQELMEQLVLVYGEREPIISGATRFIEEGAYVNAIPELRWLLLSEEDGAKPEQEIWDSFHRRLKASVEKTGIETDDALVIITASTSYLKIAETIWSGTLQEFRSASKNGDQIGLKLDGDPRPGPFQTPKGGCRVEVSVILAKQLHKASGKPWRKGTWLGRAKFDVRTEKGEIGFTPKPMDDALREKLGLPRGTLRYVEMPSTLDPSEGAVEITAYVDVDLLNDLQNNPRLDGALAFQYQIALDVTRVLVAKANRELAVLKVSSPSEIADSLCARLIEAAARTGRGDRDREREALFFNYIKNEPDRYLAYEEARLTKLKSILQKSMRPD
jgi:hypothetical protein